MTGVTFGKPEPVDVTTYPLVKATCNLYVQVMDALEMGYRSNGANMDDDTRNRLRFAYQALAGSEHNLKQACYYALRATGHQDAYWTDGRYRIEIVATEHGRVIITQIGE